MQRSQTSMINAFEKENIHKQESGIKAVNIKLISFNSNHSMISAILKTSSKQVTITMRDKVDSCCDGNIMPFNVFKNYSLTTED